MRGAAERMRLMRARRRGEGARVLRLLVPDPRSPAVRERIARQVAGLSKPDEADALAWIEAVGEFDAPNADPADETR